MLFVLSELDNSSSSCRMRVHLPRFASHWNASLSSERVWTVDKLPTIQLRRRACVEHVRRCLGLATEALKSVRHHLISR